MIVQVLLLKGANFHIKDANGLLAKDVTKSEVIKMLIDKYEEYADKNPASAQSVVALSTKSVVVEEIKEEEDDEEEAVARH